MIRLRQSSPTDSPSLMHIEQTCRTGSLFLPPALRDPGLSRPRHWRAWLTCAPPFDRHPTTRAAFVAYEHNDLLGFIGVMHDSLFAGYQADIATLCVLPRHRRRGIATRLLRRAAQWLQADDIARATTACYAQDPSRHFFARQGAFVIASPHDDADPAATITYGFVNLKEIAAQAAANP